MRNGELLLNWLFALGPLLLGMPIIWFTGLALEAPSFVFYLMVTLFILGFGLFFSAKLSVIKAGNMFSFGTVKMNKKYKVMYMTGYVIMVLGLIVLASLAIATNINSDGAL